MGLNAVVYRKKAHLDLGQDEERATVIPETGEVHFEDEKLERKYYRQREAVSHRLGNIAMIGSLRYEVSQLLGPESFLERRVLYSESHSGDAIPVQEIDELSIELDRISKIARSSPIVQELVSTLRQLIQAAKDEDNPIVFV
jgi:hypothetical protein